MSPEFREALEQSRRDKHTNAIVDLLLHWRDIGRAPEPDELEALRLPINCGGGNPDPEKTQNSIEERTLVRDRYRDLMRQNKERPKNKRVGATVVIDQVAKEFMKHRNWVEGIVWKQNDRRIRGKTTFP